MVRSKFSSFPFSGSPCDVCGKLFDNEPRYNCLQHSCFDVDMCAGCYRAAEKAPFDNIPHKFEHRVIYICVLFMPDQLQRIGLEVDDIIEHLQQQYNAQQRSNTFTAARSKSQKDETVIPENQAEEAVETTAEAGEDSQKPTVDVPQEDKDIVQETDEGLGGKTVIPSETGTQNDSEKDVSLEGKANVPPKTQNDSEAKDVSEDRLTSEYKQFKCGRCSEFISFESDFYRCVGHSCQDYYLCEKCAIGERYEAEENGHQWWHTLLCLRKDMITGNHSDPPPSTDTAPVEASQKETEATKATPSSRTIESKILKIEEILNSIYSSHFSLEEKRNGDVGRLEETVGCLKSDMSRLDEKVGRLEAKMDDMMAAIKQLLLLDSISSKDTSKN